MNKYDLIDLKIEKLTYGGEGLGRTPEGIAVFVSDTVAGDEIKAEIVSVKKNHAKGVLQEIITPSEHRIKPVCPMSKVCGGCQWQHISYEEQLRAKKQIIEECMHSIAGTDIQVKDVLSTGNTTEYRCKVQYPVGQKINSKRFVSGYYKKGSHELVNIKYCPTQPRIIDEISEYLKTKAFELDLTAYNEKAGKGLIRHFVFRYSKTNDNLTLTIVINAENSDLIKDLCMSVKDEFPQITGVLANYNTTRTNLIMGKTIELITGQSYVEEVLDGKTFKISADSFFQVNPEAALIMFKESRKILEDRFSQRKDLNILDVYSGSGSFSFFVSDISSQITAVEESETAINDGQKNSVLNNIQNINFIKGNADKVLQELADKDEKFDAIILDPPRKGCSEAVINALKQLGANYIIYVSCNPSTLARDIKLLSEVYTAEFIQPVDMFSHTYHVESIAVLKKSVN